MIKQGYSAFKSRRYEKVNNNRTERYEKTEKQENRTEKQENRTEIKIKQTENKLRKSQPKRFFTDNSINDAAERWFQERMISPLSVPDTQTESNTDTEIKSMYYSDSPSLNDIESQILAKKHTLCRICNSNPEPEQKLELERCHHIFCKDCVCYFSFLYNRCPSCSKIIDEKCSDLYEGDDFYIPCYDRFEYYDDLLDILSY